MSPVIFGRWYWGRVANPTLTKTADDHRCATRSIRAQCRRRASQAAPLPSSSYTITTDTTEIMTKSKFLRMDNVGIVVESLDNAISFFTELGLTLEGDRKSTRLNSSH